MSALRFKVVETAFNRKSINFEYPTVFDFTSDTRWNLDCFARLKSKVNGAEDIITR